jgi:cytochrome subunit of sulfide dehydrogenase
MGMPIRRITVVSALVGGLAFIAQASAGRAAADVADADVSVIAGNCANCHGTKGRSPGAIPGIAGAPYAVLKAQLLAYQADEIPGTTVMNRLAKGYTESELDAIARYFSEIPDQEEAK